MLNIPYPKLIEMKTFYMDNINYEEGRWWFKLFLSIVWKYDSYTLRLRIKKAITKPGIVTIDRNDIIDFCIFANFIQTPDAMVDVNISDEGKYVAIFEIGTSTYTIVADKYVENTFYIERSDKNKSIRKEYSEIYSNSEIGSRLLHTILVYLDKYITS